MISSENPGSYKNLRRQVRVPIAAGEQWVSKWSFRQVIEEELIDYARIDLCIVWRHHRSRQRSPIGQKPTTSTSSRTTLWDQSPQPLASRYAWHPQTSGVQEMPRQPGTNNTDLFPVQIGWEDGYAFCNDAPGLGIEMDMDVAEANAGDPSWLDTPTTPQRRRVHELVVAPVIPVMAPVIPAKAAESRGDGRLTLHSRKWES